MHELYKNKLSKQNRWTFIFTRVSMALLPGVIIRIIKDNSITDEYLFLSGDGT